MRGEKKEGREREHGEGMRSEVRREAGSYVRKRNKGRGEGRTKGEGKHEEKGREESDDEEGREERHAHSMPTRVASLWEYYDHFFLVLLFPCYYNLSRDVFFFF